MFSTSDLVFRVQSLGFRVYGRLGVLKKVYARFSIDMGPQINADHSIPDKGFPKKGTLVFGNPHLPTRNTLMPAASPGRSIWEGNPKL